MGGFSCFALRIHSASGFELRILPHDVSKQTRETIQIEKMTKISPAHRPSEFHTNITKPADAVQHLTVDSILPAQRETEECL